MKNFLNKPVTKDDKDDALKIIEEYRSNFNNLIKEMTDSTTTKWSGFGLVSASAGILYIIPIIYYSCRWVDVNNNK